MRKLPSAGSVVDDVYAAKNQREQCEVIRADRNAALEAAAEPFERKGGGPYGAASVAGFPRKLKAQS